MKSRVWYWDRVEALKIFNDMTLVLEDLNSLKKGDRIANRNISNTFKNID